MTVLATYCPKKNCTTKNRIKDEHKKKDMFQKHKI